MAIAKNACEIKERAEASWLPIGGAARRAEGGYVAVLPESVGISIASDYSTWSVIPLACPISLRSKWRLTEF